MKVILIKEIGNWKLEKENKEENEKKKNKIVGGVISNIIMTVFFWCKFVLATEVS